MVKHKITFIKINVQRKTSSIQMELWTIRGHVFSYPLILWITKYNHITLKLHSFYLKKPKAGISRLLPRTYFLPFLVLSLNALKVDFTVLLPTLSYFLAHHCRNMLPVFRKNTSVLARLSSIFVAALSIVWIHFCSTPSTIKVNLYLEILCMRSLYCFFNCCCVLWCSDESWPLLFIGNIDFELLLKLTFRVIITGSFATSSLLFLVNFLEIFKCGCSCSRLILFDMRTRMCVCVK